ncbi:UNVERIFIED_CONTAM: hypothetical protein FKN15_066646 [Acipenser sinensis]
MTVHDKFLALGTHFGKVFLLDIQGNVTQKFDISPVKINHISLDDSGEHVGICSEDGKLQLYERNWLNRWKTLTLHEGEGTITNIKWKANLIAWANSVGVKIYDISTRQRITNVLRDNASLRPDMYPCSLCWKDSTTLVIGWGTSVKICAVKERDPTEVRDLPSRYVEIEHSEGESLFYIISPKDIVVAKERDQDDHIDWLLDKKKYEEALMAAEISFKNIKRHEVQKIGIAYINHLVEKGEYDVAARKCQKVLGKNMELWENEVYRFKTIGQLKALEICQQRNFVEETVFLLSRMGNSRRALQMIMEELHDVDKAIEFAKEQDDAELWEDLISYSIDKPPFITGLLNNIGTHVDPILLIHRIKEDMEIPSLRDSLVKILQDYNLQILLREGCKKILVADSLSLLKKMQRTQMRGVRVDEENICEACHAPILPTDTAKVFNVVVFHCRHMFHKECLPSPSTIPAVQFCNICSAKRRGPGNAIMEI